MKTTGPPGNLSDAVRRNTRHIGTETNRHQTLRQIGTLEKF
jgi:hypothetical protein